MQRHPIANRSRVALSAPVVDLRSCQWRSRRVRSAAKSRVGSYGRAPTSSGWMSLGLSECPRFLPRPLARRADPILNSAEPAWCLPSPPAAKTATRHSKAAQATENAPVLPTPRAEYPTVGDCVTRATPPANSPAADLVDPLKTPAGTVRAISSSPQTRRRQAEKGARCLPHFAAQAIGASPPASRRST